MKIFEGKDQWIYYTPDWVEKHLQQFRDTVRTKIFLTDFYEKSHLKRHQLSLKYRILYDNLFPDNRDDHMTKDVIYRCLSNSLIINKTRDKNAYLDGYGLLRNLSPGSLILKDYPYFIKYYQDLVENDKFDFTNNNFSVYPENQNGTGKKIIDENGDLKTTGNKLVWGFGHQSNSIFYYPDSASVALDFKLSPSFDEIGKNIFGDMFAYNSDVDSFVCKDTITDAIDYHNLNNGNSTFNVSPQSVLDISPYQYDQTPDDDYRDIDISSLEVYPVIPNYTAIISYDTLAYHLNFRANGSDVSSYAAPYFQGDDLNEGEEVYEIFGTDNNCFFDNAEGCNNTRSSYTLSGYNCYFINTLKNIGKLVTVKLESNPKSHPVYYRLIYLNTNDENDFEERKLKLLNLASNLSEIGKNLESGMDRRNENEFVIIEGTLNPWKDQIFIEQFNLTDLPFALITSTIAGNPIKMKMAVK